MKNYFSIFTTEGIDSVPTEMDPILAMSADIAKVIETRSLSSSSGTDNIN